eukprot:m.164309 g.164309  ORF g.164309 m.164309 type:complete len:1065 (-) comp16574_c0_seq2:159-3353(-)
MPTSTSAVFVAVVFLTSGIFGSSLHFDGQAHLSFDAQPQRANHVVSLSYRPADSHLASNGVLFLSRHGNVKDFLSIELVQGGLFVQTELGSGTARVYWPRADAKQWHQVTVSQLNQGDGAVFLKVKLDQHQQIVEIKPGSIHLDVNSGTFVGGFPSLPFSETVVANGFVGCLANVTVDDVELTLGNATSGSTTVAESCSVSLLTDAIVTNTHSCSSTHCTCRSAFTGVACDEDAVAVELFDGVNASMSFEYPFNYNTLQDRLVVGVRPTAESGIIFSVVGDQNSDSDVLRLDLVRQRLRVTVDLGNGREQTYSMVKLELGRWYDVDYRREGTHHQLWVDGVLDKSWTSTPGFFQLNLKVHDAIHVGADSPFYSLSSPRFVGLLQGLAYQGLDLLAAMASGTAYTSFGNASVVASDDARLVRRVFTTTTASTSTVTTTPEVTTTTTEQITTTSTTTTTTPTTTTTTTTTSTTVSTTTTTTTSTMPTTTTESTTQQATTTTQAVTTSDSSTSTGQELTSSSTPSATTTQEVSTTAVDSGSTTAQATTSTSGVETTTVHVTSTEGQTTTASQGSTTASTASTTASTSTAISSSSTTVAVTTLSSSTEPESQTTMASTTSSVLTTIPGSGDESGDDASGSGDPTTTPVPPTPTIKQGGGSTTASTTTAAEGSGSGSGEEDLTLEPSTTQEVTSNEVDTTEESVTTEGAVTTDDAEESGSGEATVEVFTTEAAVTTDETVTEEDTGSGEVTMEQPTTEAVMTTDESGSGSGEMTMGSTVESPTTEGVVTTDEGSGDVTEEPDSSGEEPDNSGEEPTSAVDTTASTTMEDVSIPGENTTQSSTVVMTSSSVSASDSAPPSTTSLYVDPSFSFSLEADFIQTFEVVTEEELSNSIHAGFENQGVDTSGTRFEFAPGSITVEVFGPAAATDGMQEALEAGPVDVVVNGQVLKAIEATTTTMAATTVDVRTTVSGPEVKAREETSSSSSSGGGAAAIGAAVGVVIAIAAVIGYVVYRRRQEERGSYEVDEANHANEIIDDELAEAIAYGDHESHSGRSSEAKFESETFRQLYG